MKHIDLIIVQLLSIKSNRFSIKKNILKNRIDQTNFILSVKLIQGKEDRMNRTKESLNDTTVAKKLLEQDPEVKSFIYQQIVDFEPYVTPTTAVAVIAKDPRPLKERLEKNGHKVSEKEFSKLFRISIVLSENGTQLQAEAVDYDIYHAIKKAKDILLKKLIVVQDKIMSNKERNLQINHYLQFPIKH